MDNVSLYPGSPMTVEDILEGDFTNVIVATGSTWRGDGIGRSRGQPVPGSDLSHVFTPDDLLIGRLPDGHVVIYDDDHYYKGGVLAELLSQKGCQVSLVTPAPLISFCTQYTPEQKDIQLKLINIGVSLVAQHRLDAIGEDTIALSYTISGTAMSLHSDAVVLVTDRLPNESLFQALQPSLSEGRLDSLRVIGDAEAPHIIAQAVFSGHLAAREFEEKPTDSTPFRIECAAL